jgi:hypothetical protein
VDALWHRHLAIDAGTMACSGSLEEIFYGFLRLR